VAIDALAVFVHKDNPVDQLTFKELDAIFSATRKCGAPRPIRVWGDLKLGGAWGDKPISAYGRNSASGTYGFFKEHALCAGDFRDTVKEQPGSASVVQGISEDRFGIGYSGIGYRTSAVKTVSLSDDGGESYHETTPEEVYAGRYPLARFLYIYVNNPPHEPLDPLVREFLLFVLSREGQQVVVKDRYLPLTAEMVAKERSRLQ
jgi:phosphate transport system substrate-binding protein